MINKIYIGYGIIYLEFNCHALSMQNVLYYQNITTSHEYDFRDNYSKIQIFLMIQLL